MRPTLLFHCQHAVGIGHLMRALLLAERLADRHRVVFLNGGPFPPGIAAPAGVEVIDLPPLGLEDGHHLVSRDAAIDVEEAKARRRARVLEVFEQVRPDVLLIELFPFGRKKFAFELLPLLKAAHRSGAARPLVLCSVRDILVSARPDQQHHDDRAAWLCKRYFDAVLVHADPAITDFSASFRPARPLAVPLVYTGFVGRESGNAVSGTGADGGILVSVGGGLAGGPLLRLALQACPRLTRTTGLRMRMVAGPFLPEEDWQALRHAARGMPGLDLLRSVPDLGAEMRRARVSVSQCGYNTAMDILGSGVPALVVPYLAGREDEQLSRAQRFQSLGLLRMVPPTGLDADALATQIEVTLSFRPRSLGGALDGAARTAQVVERLREQRRTGTAQEVRRVA